METERVMITPPAGDPKVGVMELIPVSKCDQRKNKNCCTVKCKFLGPNRDILEHGHPLGFSNGNEKIDR